MQKHIILDNGRELEYTLRYSKRARRIGLSVNGAGAVMLTLPHKFLKKGSESGQRFMYEKSDWLAKQVDRISDKPKISLPNTRADYLKHKSEAYDLVCARVEHFNQHYGYRFNDIKIKNQKTRWGSCSSQGNLNFNFRILFLPEKLRDYIVVHELCHLKQMNHSQKFWTLVEQTIPDYKVIKKELKNYNLNVQ
jgi:predicted metal-dependent hydrolase